jgi:hypothetical protein
MLSPKGSLFWFIAFDQAAIFTRLSEALLLFLLYFACRHDQHDTQCNSAAQFNILKAPYEMMLKAERDIQPAVDPPHRSALFVKPFPRIDRAGQRGEDAPILGQGDAHLNAYRTLLIDER